MWMFYASYHRPIQLFFIMALDMQWKNEDFKYNIDGVNSFFVQ